MGGEDHRRTILRLAAAGRLDDAVAALQRADASGHATGVTILVRLARALLGAGRQEEALDLLDRAARISPFDPTVVRISTEVGHQVRGPGSGRDTPAPDRAEEIPSFRELAAEDSPTLDLSVVPLSELVSDGLASESTEPSAGGTLDGMTVTTRMPSVQPPRGLETRHVKGREERSGHPSGDDETTEEDDLPPPSAPPAEDATDRVVSPAGRGASEDLPTGLHTIGAEPGGAAGRGSGRSLSSDTVPMRVPSTGDSADTKPVALPPAGASGDTDRVEVPYGAAPRTEETGPPPDTDPDSMVPEGDRAATQRMAAAPPPSPADDDLAPAGEVLDGGVTTSFEIDGLEPRRSPPAPAPAPAAPSPAPKRSLPIAAETVTRKIDLDDVEVVGEFVSGSGRSPRRRVALEIGAAGEPLVDFGAVPDSDTLQRRLAAAGRDRDGPEPATGASLAEAPRGDAELAHGGRPGPGAAPQPPTDSPRPAPSGRRARPSAAVTARVALPRSGRRSRGRALLLRLGIGAAAVFALGAGVAFSWIALVRRAEAEEVRAARALVADDSFASHREALAALARLCSRYPRGEACAEHAFEAATMWGRFGLGPENAETARRELATCAEGRDDAAVALARGVLALHGGDEAEAEALARAALSASPEDARLRTLLAEAREAQGDLDDATRELGAARAADPRYLPAALALARIHRRSNRRAEARLMLDEILRLNPSHVEARAEELMLALDLAGDRLREPAYAEMRAMASDLENASQGEPPAVTARILVARGRLRLAEGNIEQAGQLLGRASRLGRPSPDAAIYVAQGLRLSGNLAGAIEVATKVEGGGVPLAMERALALVAAGRPAPAIIELAALRRQGADRATVGRLEAMARLQAGDGVAATAVLQALLDETPDSNTTVALAEAQLERGRGGDAARVLAKVSARPWAACAEARRLELKGQARRALDVLEERGDAAAACSLRVRALLASRLGDGITEVSSLRSLLREDPRFEDRAELVRAVWRERGSRAAAEELRPILDAAPTGEETLPVAVDLLVETGRHGDLDRLIDSARRGGASDEVLAVAEARAARLRGHPQAAIEALVGVEGDGARLRSERAAALVALGRAREALPLVERIPADASAAAWVEAEIVLGDALAGSVGRAEADRHLDRGSRLAAEAGNLEGAQRLALRRVELALTVDGGAAEVRGLLRLVPAWPPTPLSGYLAGQAAEAMGDSDGAVRAYSLALEVDGAHIPSLTRLVELGGSPDLRRRLRALAPGADPRAADAAGDGASGP